MPKTTDRRGMAELLRAMLRHVVSKQPVAEHELPDRIRQDIGLLDGQSRPKRRTEWQDWNM